MKNKSFWLLRCMMASLLLTASPSAVAVDPSSQTLYNVDYGEEPSDAREEIRRAHNEAGIRARSSEPPNFKEGHLYFSSFEEKLGTYRTFKLLQAYHAKNAGFLDEAEELYREVLKGKPDNPWILNGLGYLLAEKDGGQAEAIELLERAATLAPDKYEIVDSLAWAHYRQGSLREANYLIDEALMMVHDPQFKGVLLAHAGEIKWEIGLRDDASLLWGVGLAEDDDEPLVPETMRRYGQDVPEGWGTKSGFDGEWEAGRVEDEEGSLAAYEHLKGYVNLWGPHSNNLYNLARLAVRANLREEAIGHYRDLVVLNPGDTSSYYELGSLLVDEGHDVPGAIEVLRKGLAHNPDDYSVLDAYGWALYHSGDFAGALVALEKSLANHDDEFDLSLNASTIARKGAVLWELGRKEEALSAWRQAWELNREWGEYGEIIRILDRYNVDL